LNISEKIRELKLLVIIPTYNNEKTIGQIIRDVHEFTKDILVVDDGCTDGTGAILVDIKKVFPELQILKNKNNMGKGASLRSAFKKGYEMGMHYGITIDSDGQHFAVDMPLFVKKIIDHPGALIVGERNMTGSDIPSKSSFGHKFSNFWFRFETGIDLPDTQSGFRLYPLDVLSRINLFTTKYEMEIEILVRCAWRGVPILSVPIKVFYEPKETRVSHFRPIRDFTRVSVLNTVLVIITLLWIRPRNVLIKIFRIIILR